MKSYNFLLLSSSNHVQLINSFKDAFKLLKLRGNFYTADVENCCASRMVSKKHFQIPRSDSAEFFPALEEIIKNHGINILLSARDEELFLLSKNKKFFDELNCLLLISDEKSISLCLDKYKLSQFFEKNNIPHPNTYLFKELKKISDIEYPLICKPRLGKGGYGIYTVNNYDSIPILIKEPSKYIFQTYVKGIEFTIDVLNDLTGNILSIIPRRRILIKGGESIVSITEKNTQIISYSKFICEKIKFIGHINIQCIMKEHTPYFIEINPRFGGASNIAFKAGMESPLKILQIIKGENVKQFIGEFRENLIMLRYTQDFFITKDKS